MMRVDRRPGRSASMPTSASKISPLTLADRLQHALAAVARLVAVAQLDRLVRAGRGARRHRGAADGAALQRRRRPRPSGLPRLSRISRAGMSAMALMSRNSPWHARPLACAGWIALRRPRSTARPGLLPERGLPPVRRARPKRRPPGRRRLAQCPTLILPSLCHDRVGNGVVTSPIRSSPMMLRKAPAAPGSVMSPTLALPPPPCRSRPASVRCSRCCASSGAPPGWR